MGSLAHIRVLSSSGNVELARESSTELTALLAPTRKVQRNEILGEKGEAHPVHISVFAQKMLVEVLTELSNGNAVGIILIHAEITTQEAAHLLNGSRPFLVQLLERGEIPFHKVGAYRRVRFDDVITYKNRVETNRLEASDELADQAQKLNLGY